MGQKELSSSLKTLSTPSLKCFDFLAKIGEGGFGKVYKVRYFKDNRILALKQLSKEKIIEKKMIKYIFNERDILLSLYSNSISNLYCTFQDKNNLFMVLDYLPGGDLRSLISHYEFFLEEEIKFISGCIVSGLEYIHSNNIIHRDLKPENLIFDEKGFIRISDFGISIFNNNINLYNDTSGTIGYISPERFYRNHKISFESDYFSLGVIIYELINFERPFKKEKKYEVIEEFENNKINLNKDNVNNRYSENLCNFVNQLLEIDNTKRLGYNGILEIKNHNFFKNFDWKSIYYYKSRKSPFYMEKKNDKEKIEKRLNYKEMNDNNIDEKYQKYFDNFTKIHVINESNFITNYKNKIKSIPSSISGKNLFKTGKKRCDSAKNKIKDYEGNELFKNSEKKLFLKNNENYNFTKIFNIEKKKDKNNHIYTQFKNKRNFDYIKKKNQSKSDLPIIHLNLLQKRINISPEKDSEKEMKNFKKQIIRIKDDNSFNNSLFNENKTLLKVKNNLFHQIQLNNDKKIKRHNKSSSSIRFFLKK